MRHGMGGAVDVGVGVAVDVDVGVDVDVDCVSAREMIGDNRRRRRCATPALVEAQQC